MIARFTSVQQLLIHRVDTLLNPQELQAVEDSGLPLPSGLSHDGGVDDPIKVFTTDVAKGQSCIPQA